MKTESKVGLLIAGVFGIVVVLTGKGALDMISNMFGGGWKAYSEKLTKYYEEIITSQQLAFTGESNRYGELQTWYADALAQINSLNEQLSEKAYNTFDVRTGVIVSASEGVKNLGPTVEKMIDSTKTATETINLAIKDTTKTTTEIATIVKDNITKVYASVVPGFMPRGEV